ncbi:MAG: TIGR02679 family protein [Actinobacteria bacterium]|nr:TIGR02679 family protein [Actinomycetota bacterium]
MPAGERSTDRRATARAALQRPALAPLWTAARRRLERNGASLAGSPLLLRNLSPEEVDAITGLLGRPRTSGAGGSLRVGLDELDAVLRRSAAACSLVDVVESAGGGLRDRQAERARQQAARRAPYEAVAGHAAFDRHPALASWLAELRRSGALHRLSAREGATDESGWGAGSGRRGDARRAADAPTGLLRRALDVLAGLPSEGIGLAALAAGAAGDAHALDRGRPLATLVESALPSVVTGPGGDGAAGGGAAGDGREGDGREVGGGAVAWRRRWAAVGVVCDDLSVSVLTLNLPAVGPDVVAHTLRDHAAVGEPVRLTLRQIQREPLRFESASCAVFVCENPSVIAHAAAALGPASGAVVCTAGVANSAVLAVLDALADSGFRLRVHADFDRGGLRIAASLLDRPGAEPWRFGASDYRTAVAEGLARTPLAVGVPDAAWDPALAPAMREAGVAVFEEQLLARLLVDLG